MGVVKESSTEGFMVHNSVEWERLSPVLAEIFGVPREAIGKFENNGPVFPILVEMNEHSKGFRLDVTIYASVETNDIQRGIPLAQRVAAALGEDVLTSPLAGFLPWYWVLARPEGLLLLVEELRQPGDNDGVFVDMTTAKLYSVRTHASPFANVAISTSPISHRS